VSLRKVLIVFQFVLALGLLTATLAVLRQTAYLRGRDLGFDMEQVLAVRAPRVRDASFEQKLQSWKESLLAYPGVRKISVVTEVPGRQILWDAGAIRKAGEDESQGKNYQIVGIDYDFADLFGVRLVAGRNFSRDFPADKEALILNETAVKFMGFASPEAAVGQNVAYWDDIRPIVGVFKDYHQQSPKAAFEPHLFRLMLTGRDVRGVFAVKIAAHGQEETLRVARSRFDEFFPGNPFESFFVDEYYAQQYRGDELLARVLGAFAALAVFVTGLGVLGLASFMATERRREIGIRKVLGAGVARVLVLLTREFLGLMLAGFLIALPLCYWGIQRWLGQFAVRMSVDAWSFVAPLGVVLAITLATVGLEVVRAALANPVEALRYE
jgi:putative ABC transport system permease protein